MMGHARGVICLAAGVNQIPLFSYASTHIKGSLTGNGHASKEQVRRMVDGFAGGEGEALGAGFAVHAAELLAAADDARLDDGFVVRGDGAFEDADAAVADDLHEAPPARIVADPAEERGAAAEGGDVERDVGGAAGREGLVRNLHHGHRRLQPGGPRQR